MSLPKENENIMRTHQRPLTDAEKQSVDDIKSMGVVFWNHCDQLGSSRELSLAKTKMEEAVMWAIKGITG